jgi:hypothetical protein
MGLLSHLFFPWGLILQAVAILHFIRRRPDTYWIFVILFLGPLGAIVYLLVEAAPDLTFLSQQSASGFSRRKRIRELEALVRVNTAVGNFEELGDLYFDEGNLPQARAAFDRAIQGGSEPGPRNAGSEHDGVSSTTLDPFYKRGACAVLMGDAPAAIPDLERVVASDPSWDFHRAQGLLAHAYALTGQKDKAEALFRQATETSTMSETYLNFAELLASEDRTAEAREWARKLLDKAHGMPAYLRRRERPWFRKAKKFLSRLPA